MERLTYRGRNEKGYICNRGYYEKVYLNMEEVADRLAAYEDILFDADGKEICTVEYLTELVKAEQKRREGCRRCWNGECAMSGFDYSCETTCDRCRYNLKDKQFCPHCGRELRGESHDDN